VKSRDRCRHNLRRPYLGDQQLGGLKVRAAIIHGFGVIFTTMAVKLWPGSIKNWCTVFAGI
jgi:hypothetical protein